MTHEIMNSVTPIVSLSAVVSETLLPKMGEGLSNQLTADELQDVKRSLQAIEGRGQGLIDFVSVYSNLANTPKPVFKVINVAELIERTVALMQPQFQAAGILLHMSLPDKKITCLADAQQVEQVLINILNNASEALSTQKNKEIKITCNTDSERGLEVSIRDNGPGISKESLPQIFVPFFTTKTKGSGVGLSISRQLMLANNGTLSVKPSPNQGAEFVLGFNA